MNHSNHVVIFLDDRLTSNLLSRTFNHSKKFTIYKQIILEFYRNDMKVPLVKELEKNQLFIPHQTSDVGDGHKLKSDDGIFDDILNGKQVDEEKLMEYIRIIPSIIEYLPKRPKYCLQAVLNDPQTLYYAPKKDIKRSESIVWELFMRDASCLRFASQRLTRGPFALRVLECNPEAFVKYCKLLNVDAIVDRDVVLKLVSLGSYFDKINSKFREDEEIQLAALKHDATIWKLLRSELQNDRSFTLSWIKKNSSILKYSEFRKDYDFMVELIRDNSYYLWSFDNELLEQLFRNDKQLLMNALEGYNGFACHKIPIHKTQWAWLPRLITQDREVVMLFLRKLCQNEMAHRYFTFTISEKTLTIHCNNSNYYYNLEKYDNYFKVYLDNFQTDRDFFSLNLSKIGLGGVYAHADESFKRDPKFIANVFNLDSNNRTTFEYDKNMLRELIPLLKTTPSQLFEDSRPLISDDKELLLLCVKNSKHCFRYASEELKENPDFIEECIKANHSVITEVSLNLVKMDKEMAKIAFNEYVEIKVLLPILKKHFDDDQILQLLATYHCSNFDNLWNITQDFKISDTLKKDYNLVRKLIHGNIKYLTMFKDAPMIKEIIIEKLKFCPSIYYHLSESLKMDLDLISMVYRKSDSRERNALLTSYNKLFKQKDILLNLLTNGVYIRNDFIDKKVLDLDYMLENCSHLVIHPVANEVGERELLQ